MNSTIRASVAAAAIAATVLAPAAAQAKGAGNINSGGCSGAATWKIKAAQQNAGLHVDFEVDARAGQRWKVTVFHNNQKVLSKIATTRAPSGSFTVHKFEANRAGNDRFRGRAVRLGDGQTCVGRVSM